MIIIIITAIDNDLGAVLHLGKRSLLNQIQDILQYYSYNFGSYYYAIHFSAIQVPKYK